MRKVIICVGLAAFLSIIPSSLWADEIKVPVYMTAEKGQGKAVGDVDIKSTQYGLLFTPDLHGLPPGLHGFHIHEYPSCGDLGQAAGGHWDPQHTNAHLGPYGNGHLGDLPALYVDARGNATLPVLAPRIKNLDDLYGHSLMIHEMGDNYSDRPEKLGGGGGRIACGEIKQSS